MNRLATAPLLLAAAFAAAPALAQTDVASPAALKHYEVSVRRFDPAAGPKSGTVFVLPVDSPDEEHAAASTMANAISFSRKTAGGRALPVAFMVERVTFRR